MNGRVYTPPFVDLYEVTEGEAHQDYRWIIGFSTGDRDDLLVSLGLSGRSGRFAATCTTEGKEHAAHRVSNQLAMLATDYYGVGSAPLLPDSAPWETLLEWSVFDDWDDGLIHANGEARACLTRELDKITAVIVGVESVCVGVLLYNMPLQSVNLARVTKESGYNLSPLETHQVAALRDDATFMKELLSQRD